MNFLIKGLSSGREEMAKLRDSLDARVKEIQAGNGKKLEEMRHQYDRNVKTLKVPWTAPD